MSEAGTDKHLLVRPNPRVPPGARLVWYWVEHLPHPPSNADPSASLTGYWPVEYVLPAEAQEVELESD